MKYPTINYRQRHTRLIDNSDDSGQLKSTRNKVNYSRWKSKSDNDEVRRKSQSMNQPSTKEADIQRRESTINDQLASAKSNNRKSIYLLIVGSHNINNQDGPQYTK